MKKIKKIIYIMLIVIGIMISLKLNRNITKLETILKDTFVSLTKNITYLTTVEAKDQTESYLIQKNINMSLEKEIEELKEVLKLNSTLSNYEKINATVISRNNQYWFNTITIDKGKKDGLKKEMAVITKNGLIGKISKITSNTSEIKLLTSSDITYKTSVVIRINEKDYHAILNGYDEEKKLLKIVAVDKNLKVTKGDSVLTSGLGNMPRGIYIGTIEDSEIDQYQLSKTIYVKTTQDFNNINYVTILKEKTK